VIWERSSGPAGEAVLESAIVSSSNFAVNVGIARIFDDASRGQVHRITLISDECETDLVGLEASLGSEHTPVWGQDVWFRGQYWLTIVANRISISNCRHRRVNLIRIS